MWLVIVALIAAPQPTPVPEALAPLQGTWKLRSAEQDGKATELKGMPSTVVIKGNAITLSFESGESKTYLIEMGAGAGAKSIDFYTTTRIGVGREGDREVRREFQGKYLENVGICEIEGKTLELCLVPWTGTEKRPTTFTTKGKPECELLTLTRQE